MPLSPLIQKEAHLISRSFSKEKRAAAKSQEKTFGGSPLHFNDRQRFK
jgi:hypothetical protein